MPVTIVIPVYNHFDILENCIASLLRHVSDDHTVLIVDDGSPERDIEKKIRNAIVGKRNFRYARNDENLGFVRTCNRAVRELDSTENDILLLNSDTIVTEGFLEEMRACLYACDRHGICCPRSNNATICTVPLKFLGSHEERNAVSHACWSKLRGSFPRWSVVPTGTGFCMLIRRVLIQRFGLFDEAFGRGYNEENDFCCRVNSYGFSTILAHRAFVFHTGSSSFSADEHHTLERTNGALLQRRYPHYRKMIEEYFERELSAMDHFADVLGGCYRRPRVLLDYSRIHAVFDGTSEYALAILPHLHELLEKTAEVSILINPLADQFFHVSKRYQRVDSHYRTLQGRFDLAFVPNQVWEPYHLALLSSSATRIVVNLHDVIALRCHKLQRLESIAAQKLLLRYGDGILSVSDSSIEDIRAFFGSEALRSDLPVRAILHGSSMDICEADDRPFPHLPEHFLLVMGGNYEHKALYETLRYLPESHSTVVLGKSFPPLRYRKRTTFLPSGKLSPHFVDDLYRRADVVIFPSQYEGFGLPILHAARHGKRIITCNTATAREVCSKLALEYHVRTFSSFPELPSVLARALAEPPVLEYAPRSWADAAADTVQFLEEILAIPVDVGRLEERFSLLNAFENTRLPKRRNPQSFLRRVIRSTALRAANLFRLL